MATFGEPSIPPNFSVVNLSTPGTYLLGHDKFSVTNDIHIVSPLQRDLTNSDDFILGVLSVLLIATLSEISHSIILRSTNKRIPTVRIVSAFLLSELTHLRNVFRYSKLTLRLLRSGGTQQQERASNFSLDSQQTSSRACTVSLYVLFFAAILFISDVLAVVFTQQAPHFSSDLQYNIRAFHPSSPASEGLSRYVRRLAGDRPCASPFLITNSTQIRNYHLLACILIQFGGTVNPGPYDQSKDVSIESFYHRGGSDHKIYFGNGFLTVSVRAQIILDKNDGGARRLLFTSLDDKSFSHARYIHEVTVANAKDWVCKKEKPPYEEWCNNNSSAIQAIETEQVNQTIYLWRGKSDSIFENATGIKSTFSGINLFNATGAFNSGVRSLISSSYAREVTGEGDYERVNDDEPEKDVPKLLGENRRITGVLLLTIVFAGLVVILLVLRHRLRPFSLGDMVLRGIDKDSSSDVSENGFSVQQIRDLGVDNNIGTGSLRYSYDTRDLGDVPGLQSLGSQSIQASSPKCLTPAILIGDGTSPFDSAKV